MATEATVASNNDDLFVDAPEPVETTNDASETDPGTETPSDATEGIEAGDGTESVEAQGETSAEAETADFELPSDAQQMKQYPKEWMDSYARRFKWNADDLATDPGKSYAVKKAIDSDIYAQTLQGQLAARTSTEETAAKAQQSQQAQQTPQEYQKQREQSLSSFVDNVFSKDVMAAKGVAIADRFARAFGIDPNSKNKEAAGIVSGLRAEVPHILRELAILAVDAQEAGAQYIVPNAMERVFPGFSEERVEKLHQSAYNEVRKSNKDYAKMPDFMSANFKAELDKAAAKIPGFDKMRFEGSQREQAKTRYEILAVGWKLANGQNLNAEETKAVYDAAQKDAKKANVARVNGNLGSGQSKGQLAPKTKGNDDIFGAKDEYPLSQRL